MFQDEMMALLKDLREKFKKLSLLNKTLIVIVGLSLTISLTIVAVYFATMPSNLSKNSSAWGDFGSLLSGLFAFTGTFAAVATLIAIQAQFKEQQIVTAKQIESIEFDRYDKHRRIFFERLESIEKLYENEIEFYNKEELYEKIYPSNSPSRCETNVYLVDIRCSKPNGLTDINVMFSSVEKILKEQSMDLRSIFEIINLQSSLHLENKKNHRNGDILFFDNNTGINIYSLNERLFVLCKTYNSILKFTGNSAQVSISHRAEGRIIRDKALHEMHGKSGIDHPFSIYRDNDALLVYEEAYLFIDAIRQKQDPTYREESYRKLEEILNNEKTRNTYTKEACSIRHFKIIMLKETGEMGDNESSSNKEKFTDFNQRLSKVVKEIEGS
ncbi:hypothetical protein M1D97_00600 [Kushneria sp. AK178]